MRPGIETTQHMPKASHTRPLRGRRIQHRHRRALPTEPGAVERRGARLHGRAPRRGHHGRGRRHVRSPHRQEGGVGLRRGGREQRTGHSAGRSDRPRRRVRAVDRPQGEGGRALERLVPGVPWRVRVALRRRSSDRWQAGAACRLGVRRPNTGPRPEEPTVGQRGQAGRRTETKKQANRRVRAKRAEGSDAATEPASRSPSRDEPAPRTGGRATGHRNRRAEVAAGVVEAPRRPSRQPPRGRLRSALRLVGQGSRQRAHAVPRVRGAPSRRDELHGPGGELRLPRRLRADR